MTKRRDPETLITERHGKTKTKAYRAWGAMKNRCDSASSAAYRYYGARGIGYSKGWALFSKFLEDMGEPPEGMSLDRIDNNADYCKENCRWATDEVQMNNTRTTIRARYRGKLMTISEIMKATGFGRSLVAHRIRDGKPLEDPRYKQRNLKARGEVKPKILVLWNERCDMLATCEIPKPGFLPLLAVCDDEFTGINPFFTYPLSWLGHYGWIQIGEL